MKYSKHLISLSLVYFITIFPSFSEIGEEFYRTSKPFLTVTDGLISNEVNCILQDSKGYMWFGTNSGLCRFDGYGFKAFKSNYLNPNLFSDNEILSLAEDQSNHLWVGTSNGLNIIDLSNLKITQVNNKYLKNSSINSIVVSSDNIIYFGTSTGLYSYDERTKKILKILVPNNKNKLSSEYIKTLFIDSKNYLWIGKWETGYSLYNLNINSFVVYPYLKDKKDLIVNSFFEDDEHNMWLSTWDQYGIWKIENPHLPTQSKLININLKKREISNSFPVVYEINQDVKTKNILLATSDGIQVIPKGSRFDLKGNNTIIPHKIIGNEVHNLFIDRTGLIWYSNFEVGIGVLNSEETLFEQYDLSRLAKIDDNTSSVTAIYEDEKNILWLGIKSYGLGLFNRQTKSFIHYKTHPVLKNLSEKSNAVYSFCKPLKTDELWLGTRYDGIFIVHFKDGNIHSLEKKEIPNVNINNLTIKEMKEDPKSNTIWIATNIGLYRAVYDSTIKKYIVNKNSFVEDKFRNIPINSLLIDKDRNLWIGSNKSGIYKLNFNEGNSISRYSLENNRINSNEILCLFQDHRKRVWAGTKGGGLSLFNQKEDIFSMIDNMNLMPNEDINSIEEDNWGNLWLGTGNGLVSYNEDLPVDKKIRIYSSNDGIRINFFNPNTSFSNNKYELFFGGINGFVVFIPQKNEDTAMPFYPVITGFSINNEPIDKLPQDKKDRISKNQISYTDKVLLDYNQKNISFEFSALTYENISSIKYAYMLEGVDKDWVYVDSKKRFVNYNNLHSGNYRFLIKTSNVNGVWSQTTHLDIIIKNAPWKTFYAYVSYFILFLVIAILIYRFVKNQIALRRKLVVEQIEIEKSEEVHQEKLKFFTNVSHEFFTPVTILKFSVDSLINKYPEDSQTFFTMKANINRLGRLLEQIMEFRKIETGNLKLKLSQIEIVSFVKEICDLYFVPLCKEKNITLNFKSQFDEIYGFIDCDKLDKIIFNLLSNAFKYNREGGTVELALELINTDQSRSLLITVSDSGYGMSREVQKNIFKRFYEGNFHNFKIKSTGIGLSLTYDLIRFHHGKISVESEEGIGSKFYVTLPIDKTEYSENEIYMENDVSTISQSFSENSNINKSELTYSDNAEERLTVMLVEDNRDLLNLLIENLKNDFNILSAENGKIALELMTTNEVDLVVTDVLMPVMDGIQLIQEMKSTVELSHIPVIVLTAKQEMEHKIEGFEAGADSYITKPFDIQVLNANIKSLIHNRRLVALSFSKDTLEPDFAKYTYNNTDKEFLERVYQIIEKNVYKKDFTTNDLYNQTGMSQSTFYRKIQTLIGVSPLELIHKIKIKVACKLLMEKQFTVAEIAYDLGFSEPRYFSKLFKKETGMSPTEFIRKSK